MTVDGVLFIYLVFGFFSFSYLLTFIRNDMGLTMKHSLQTDFTKIELTDLTGNIYYTIEPYGMANIGLLGKQPFINAAYNKITLINESHAVMTYLDKYPNNALDSNCYDYQQSSAFKINIICDPFEKMRYGVVVLYGECEYQMDMYTELGCRYMFSDRSEL